MTQKKNAKLFWSANSDPERQTPTQFPFSHTPSHNIILNQYLKRGKNNIHFFMQGMFSSRGRQLLMVDADGATKFSDFTKVQNSLNQLVDEKVCSCLF